jgi:hypothetical protein
MNQGTQGYSLMKKTEGRKSRDTVSLIVKHNAATKQKKKNMMTYTLDCMYMNGKIPERLFNIYRDHTIFNRLVRVCFKSRL